MPNINSMTSSKFLKKEDFPEHGSIVTFARFVRQNVAKNNESEEHKWVAYFAELEKGLVMNSTNLKRAARALGSENTDDWIGRKIVCYNDPNIEFGGDLVGGIRVKGIEVVAPATATPAAPYAPPQAKAAADPFADDIPF